MGTLIEGPPIPKCFVQKLCLSGDPKLVILSPRVHLLQHILPILNMNMRT